MSDISYTLDKALQQALAARDFGHSFGGRGVLINTIPGNGTIAQCQSWAKANSIKLVVINATDMDIKMNLDRVIEMADAHGLALLPGLFVKVKEIIIGEMTVGGKSHHIFTFCDVFHIGSSSAVGEACFTQCLYCFRSRSSAGPCKTCTGLLYDIFQKLSCIHGTSDPLFHRKTICIFMFPAMGGYFKSLINFFDILF